MSSYCTVTDVAAWIPLDAVQAPARLVTVNATTNVLSLSGHGLAADTEVTLRADAGGTMPGNITAGTTYYAIVLTDSTFKLSASSGGAAIDITSAGSNVLLVTELPWDAWIEEESNKLECTIPAHAVPLSTVPAVVRSFVAAMVALRALTRCGVPSEALHKQVDIVRDELKEWRRGIPLRGQVVPSATNCAVRAASTNTDPRGWVSSYGDGYIP
jgi:hypothetical protein